MAASKKKAAPPRPDRKTGAEYSFKAELWLYQGKGAWHFITLPKKTAREIHSNHGHNRRGWGSLPVVASIGQTTWKTSIFADQKRDSFLLPVKADVRKKEGVSAGQKVNVVLKMQA